MDVMEAIYQRRAVRSYTSKPVARALIDKLLRAAVQAPSAMNQQPWAFVVIQDRALLRRYSDRAKAVFLVQAAVDPRHSHFRETLGSPDFNVFYDAGTLIVICAGPGALSTAEDCCLAGENLMLAACALGLGTCPIGLARPMLNLPEIKTELDIPPEFSPVLPIIVGFPKGTTPPVARAEPRVFAWK
jgi:nitroreductase